MTTLQAILTDIGHALNHSIGGVSLYVYITLFVGVLLSAAVKAAKWTNATRLIQIAFRFILKIPVFGAAVALVPGLGDLFHFIADDAEKLPPTLYMRVKGKVPAKAAIKPTDATPPAAVLLLCLLIPTMLSGCTAAQIQAWKTFGIDTMRCVGAGVIDSAGDALTELLAGLSDNSLSALDPATVGKQLATKFGKDAALCAIGKAATILLPAAGLHMAPTPKAKFIEKMLDTQNQWAK
jgi:hypothetical protein